MPNRRWRFASTTAAICWRLQSRPEPAKALIPFRASEHLAVEHPAMRFPATLYPATLVPSSRNLEGFLRRQARAIQQLPVAQSRRRARLAPHFQLRRRNRARRSCLRSVEQPPVAVKAVPAVVRPEAAADSAAAKGGAERECLAWQWAEWGCREWRWAECPALGR